MEGHPDVLDDTSSSDKTIVVENEEIYDILNKYNSNKVNTPPASTSESTKKNFYSLEDFSDDEPLESKSTPHSEEISPKINSWQDNFLTDDFIEDSNDFDVVLKRISQLQSEQFKNETRHSCSKEMETLISGDIIEKPRSKTQLSTNTESKWNLSSDESNNSDVFNCKLQLEKFKSDVKLDIKLPEIGFRKSSNLSADLSSEDLTAELKSKKLKKKNSADKETQMLKKELAKKAKLKEREQRKLEKENEKQLKNALKIVENCIKPDQCVKYLIVNIDENISNKSYGEVIKSGLKSGGYNYKVFKQLVPNLVSWTRTVPTIEDNMRLGNVQQQEKHCMLIMDIPEFFQLIENSTLVGHIQSLLSMPQIQHLAIAILGLQKYYKYLRDRQNKEFKATVAEDGNLENRNLEFKNLPKITKKEIERKLVELQIYCKNIYIRPLDKFEELAIFVGEYTKSVAQIPHKMAKAQSLQDRNEFFTVDNRDCVRIDKDGNGLNRLWNQFLRMFPLASLETAEAVTSVYPTIHSLMEAYKSCKKPEEGERMLQDLPVRRAAGPLGCQRKLGPEFSKKAYKFFCSKENVLL